MMTEVENCNITRETIRNMCRYISDDGRIARYTGAPLDMVKRIRKCYQTVNRKHVSRTVGTGQKGGDVDQYVMLAGIDAARGSKMLADAINRHFPIDRRDNGGL